MNRWTAAQFLNAVGESSYESSAAYRRADEMDARNGDPKHTPTLVAKRGGQVRRFPLSHFTLRNGKTISPHHVEWTRRKIDVDGADAGIPTL
jgi:hypothetical protein